MELHFRHSLIDVEIEDLERLMSSLSLSRVLLISFVPNMKASFLYSLGICTVKISEQVRNTP